MNQVALTQTFQDKIFAKIRESIGDLMTEEDLSKLVHAGIQKAFFEQRKDEYNRVTKEPELVTMLGEMLRPAVTTAIAAWLKEHPEEVSKAINDCIAKGLLGIVSSYLDSQMRWPLQELANKLQQAGVLR